MMRRAAGLPALVVLALLSMRPRLFPLMFAALLAGSPAASAPPQRLYASGSWAAHRFDGRCEAASRPLYPARSREKQARAGILFDPSHRRFGQFFVRLSREPRPGSSVLLTIGKQPFLLVARGPWAWSRGPRQDSAILDEARSASGMRIEARDSSGRRFIDRYLLQGAPTAIDSAAAACAGKI